MLDQELLFLRKCRGRDDNLYVVTEAVELINSTVLHDSSSVNVLGKCFIPWMTSVKVHGCLKWDGDTKSTASPTPLPRGSASY